MLLLRSGTLAPRLAGTQQGQKVGAIAVQTRANPSAARRSAACLQPEHCAGPFVHEGIAAVGVECDAICGRGWRCGAGDGLGGMLNVQRAPFQNQARVDMVESCRQAGLG